MKIKLSVMVSLFILILILMVGRFAWYQYLIWKDVAPNSISSVYLNNKANSYMQHVVKKGIAPCLNDVSLIENNELSRVTNNRFYIIDKKMTVAKPYLTVEAHALLDTIGCRFHDKLVDTRFKNVKFIVTSTTRSQEAQMRLMKGNLNAINNSPHLYGVAFDISYVRFYRNPGIVFGSRFLKETLAEVILELKNESKCWALTEINQNCYHIVARFPDMNLLKKLEF